MSYFKLLQYNKIYLKNKINNISLIIRKMFYILINIILKDAICLMM